MKKLRVFRHSLRDGEYISPYGLELIAQKKSELIPCSTIFASPYVRTVETGAAMFKTMKIAKGKIIQINDLECAAVEQALIGHKAFMNAYSVEAGIYLAMGATMDRETIYELEEICGQALLLCFANLGKTEGMVVWHNPYIQMAAKFFARINGDPSSFGETKEMEYVDFIMEGGKVIPQP